MAPPTTTASAFLPWITRPQSTCPTEATSFICRHPQRSLSDDGISGLPLNADKAVAVSSYMNVRRNSLPDPRSLFPAINSRSRKHTNDELDMDKSLISLRPIIQEHLRLPLDGHHSHQPHRQQLPPIQHITIEEPYQIQNSPPLSCASQSSQSNSLSSWSPTPSDSLSRKGSIASLLNSDSENRLPPFIDRQQDDTVMAVAITAATPTPTPTRRGRPRATKRKRNDINHDENNDDDDEVDQKKRSVTKGLRHFSKLVSDKVAERGVTTYNQVADELASEIRSINKVESTAQSGFDQKNIRRRVYDALNVLMAMDIISKDKKEIRWLGIPSCFRNESSDGNYQSREQQCQPEQRQIEEKIRKEEERYQWLTEQIQHTHLAITNRLNEYLRLQDLVSRNEKRPLTNEQLVHLPFSVIRCNQDDNVDVAPDGRHAVIVSTNSNRNEASSVHSDFDILQSLGYDAHQCSYLPDSSWYPFLCPPSSRTVHSAAS